MHTQSIDTETRYADLAETVLAVAREIRLREYGSADGAIPLTPSNAQVMRFIDAHPGATSSEAAEATGLLRSNLSTAVRELEKIGFIEKRRDPTDGRGVLLYSTAAAAHNLALVRAQWSRDAENALDGAEDVEAATGLLRLLADSLVEERRASGLRWHGNQL